MNDSNFKIFGDQNLLKDIKINIVETRETRETRETGEKKVNTLLFLGKKSTIEAETETSVLYTVYVSYKDSLVNSLKFENIMRNSNTYINHLYISKKDDSIILTYIGRESKINEGVNIVLLPKKEFFRNNNIEKQEEMKDYENLFFDNY